MQNCKAKFADDKVKQTFSKNHVSIPTHHAGRHVSIRDKERHACFCSAFERPQDLISDSLSICWVYCLFVCEKILSFIIASKSLKTLLSQWPEEGELNFQQIFCLQLVLLKDLCVNKIGNVFRAFRSHQHILTLHTSTHAHFAHTYIYSLRIHLHILTSQTQAHTHFAHTYTYSLRTHLHILTSHTPTHFVHIYTYSLRIHQRMLTSHSPTHAHFEHTYTYSPSHHLWILLFWVL